MSLTYLNTAMIEQPASINQLSANNLQAVSFTGLDAYTRSLSATSLTADNLQIGSIAGVQSINGDLNVTGSVYALSGNSNQWNQTYSLVQANSASWEESNEILPTVTNYLSTNNVLFSSINTLNTISSGGIALDSIFITNTTLNSLSGDWENAYTTLNQVSGRYNNTSTVVEGASGTWNNTATTLNLVSGNYENTFTAVVLNSSTWQDTYTSFSQNSGLYTAVYTTVNTASGTWNDTTTTLNQISGNAVNTTTTVAANSGNWQGTYTNYSQLSTSYAETYTTVNATSAQWNQGYNTSVTITPKLSNWDSTYTTVNTLSNSIVNTQTTVSANSATWGLAGNTTTTVAANSSIWSLAGDTTTTVAANSSNWQNTYTLFSTNSSNYDSTYSVVAQNSASWEESGDTLPTIINYLSTSNVVISSLQGVNNNLNILGNLTVTGSISALSALQITETTYLTGYSTLLSSLEVEGDINTTGGRLLSASINLNNLFVNQAAYNVDATKWNNNYSTVNSLSSNWTNTYSSYSAISSTLNALTTAIQSTPTDNVYIETNNNSNSLKIKQTGSGNALVIEDSSGTDTTPFIVNPNGDVIIGHTGTIVTSNFVKTSITPKIEVIGTSSSTGSIGLYSYNPSPNQVSNIVFNRSKSNNIGVNEALSAEDIIGGIAWSGDDGNSFECAASILCLVDDAVEADSVPGRITFNTASQLSSVVEERALIDSQGNVRIFTDIPVEVRNDGVNIGQFGTPYQDNVLEVYGNTYIDGTISLSSGYGSDEWTTAYTAISTLNNTYSVVNTLSTNWNTAYATTTSLSSNLWNEAYSLVQTNSASWNYQGTDIKALTANWESTYATVCSLSTSWEESANILPTVTNYLSTSNVVLSGLTTQNITITSNNVFGTTSYVNTVSALAITVNGTTLYLPLLSAI